MCVYSDSWEDHLSHLEILSEAGLTVKLCKCSFARSQVQYLGHYIGGGKIAPVDAKIQAIAAMDRPSTKKVLRYGFVLGLQTKQLSYTQQRPRKRATPSVGIQHDRTHSRHCRQP